MSVVLYGHLVRYITHLTAALGQERTLALPFRFDCYMPFALFYSSNNWSIKMIIGLLVVDG
jgi:hypothetical protein